MAQKRYHEYQTSLTSDKENKQHLGQFFSGRYSGFDTITSVSGANFSILHTSTGVKTVDTAGVLSNPTGTLITPQGVVITEDAIIGGFTLATNVGNGSNRIDLLVCNHSWAATPGGNAATYTIVQGPSGSYTKPTLANNQTELAAFHLLAGQTGATALTEMLAGNQDFIPAIVPDMGGTKSAKLTDYNKFLKRLDTANGVAATYITISGSYAKANLPKTSNTLRQVSAGGSSLYLAGLQIPPGSTDGVTILLKPEELGTDDFKIVHQYAGSVGTGFAKIVVPAQFFNNTEGVYYNPGDIIELTFANSIWTVTNVILTNALSPAFNQVGPKLAQGLFQLGAGGPAASYVSGTQSYVAGVNTFTLNTTYLQLVGNKIQCKVAGKYKFTLTCNQTFATSPNTTIFLRATGSISGNNINIRNFINNAGVTENTFTKSHVITCPLNDTFDIQVDVTSLTTFSGFSCAGYLMVEYLG